MGATGANGCISEDRLPVLDGLRGLAAIFVMLYHAELMFGTGSLFSRSYLFVDFFFLLSGFVLTLSAEARMRNGLPTARFLRARVARLWPIIALGVTFGAARHAAVESVPDAGILLVAGLLMIPALWQTGMIFPLNAPQWSLMLELFANLAHALLLRRLGENALLMIAVLSGLALAATVLEFGSNTLGPFTFNWWLALPRVVFSYTLGIWLARKWKKGRHGAVVPWKLALLLPPLALITLPAWPLPIATGDILVVLLVFPPLLWCAAVSQPAEPARKYLDALGALSFPLYAFHLPILETIAPIGKSWTVMLLAAGTTVIAALPVVAGVRPDNGKRRRAAPT